MSNSHPRGAQKRHPSQHRAAPQPRVEVPGDLRLRAERAEARVAVLEGENATLRFNAAATPKYQPAPEQHGWDVE